MTILVVDVGNTRVKWALVAMRDAAAFVVRADDAPAPGGAGSAPVAAIAGLVAAWQRSATTPVVAAFVSNVAAPERVDDVRTAVRSVWPAAACVVATAAPAGCGVVNGYRDAARLGSDRWFALVAAHAMSVRALAGPGAVLVCGFGTATTIDLLVPDADGTSRFVGGLILPGFDAMRDGLAAATARLPRVADGIGGAADFGTSTDDAIASGIVAAQVGAVAFALAAARARIPSSGIVPPHTCLFAGGGAATVATQAGGPENRLVDAPIRVVPDLVLRGLVAFASDTLRRAGSLVADPAGP